MTPTIFNEHGNLCHQPTLDKLAEMGRMIDSIVEELLGAGIEIVEIRALEQYFMMEVGGTIAARIIGKQLEKKRT